MTETSVQRRLAAILAADVVGYSKMMGEDEAGTLVAIKGLCAEVIEPKIAEHKGRLFKTMGDGFLVEFPSVVNAVACAVAIQKATAERNAALPEGRAIQLRIGVNLGDVIVEGEDIFGDGVNVAVRLEGVALPGGIAVSGTVGEHLGNRLELSFEDVGELKLKNIVRPVRVYRSTASAHAKTEKVQPERTKPSIAVLPFVNMSGDPGQDYFADGITEDVITALSRIKWLFVIARNSTATYKGKAVDVREIGRNLGVRYVLEGGLQKLGQRLRITVKLIDTLTGAQVWANRYDGRVEDVFDLQDQITEQVVAQVEPNVQKHEIERSRQKRPDSLDAYDLYLQALPFTASQTAEEGRTAIGFLERALQIDPDYAAAHALAAWCYEWCYSRGGFDEQDKARALRHARLAVRAATDDASALAVAGFVIVMLDKDHSGLNAIDRALVINPSCATALFVGSAANAFMGRSGEALSYAQRALRLSPLDFLVSVAHTAQGVACIQEARYEEASVHLDHSVETNPDLSSFKFFAACAHALAGNLPKGRVLLNEGLTMEPGFKLRFFFELLPPDVAEKLASGGRTLGLAE